MPGNTEIVDLAERIVPLQGVSIPELSPIISTLSLPEDHDTSVPSSTTFPCECKFSPCYSNFDPDKIQDIRHQYIALTDKELDIALLSKLACGIHLDPLTRRSRKLRQNVRHPEQITCFMATAFVANFFSTSTILAWEN